MAGALLAADYYEDDDEEDQEQEGTPAEGVEVPDDAYPECAAFYAKVNRRYGVLEMEGNKPWWDCSTDGTGESLCSLSLDMEEFRRGLPAGKLHVLARHSDASTAEYRTGRTRKLEGTCMGAGEKIGKWDAFTCFDPEVGQTDLGTLETGRTVKCNGHEACVARILRCTKAAGKAGENKTEQVFLVLMRLKCGDWKYAAMRHVEQLDPLEEYDLEAIASNAAALETALQNFEPVSVSKASKDARRDRDSA